MNKNVLKKVGTKTVEKQGNVIKRPSNSATYLIHDFLKSIRKCGFLKGPTPIQYDEHNEWITYVEGRTYDSILPLELRDDDTLISVAKLLKEYHDSTIEFVHSLKGDEDWLLPVKEPVEVICHGDFAPYNLTVCDGVVTGVIDFDTIHPGPRKWDVVYTMYRFVPLNHESNDLDFGSLKDKIRRSKVFCDAYGLDDYNLSGLIDLLVIRLESLVDYMFKESEKGNVQFIENIQDGHHLVYKKDIEFLKKLKENI